MKTIINRSIRSLAVATCVLLLAACTDHFEEYNQKIGEPNDQQIMEGNYKLGAFFPQLINYAYPVQENAYQMSENLIGDPYGRYLSIANNWATNFSTFNAPDGWIDWPFREINSKVLGSFTQIKTLTKGEGHLYAWAVILKVTAMQRLTDLYGPIPYSKTDEGNIAVPYDDQETVYKSMFADLDGAINTLTAFNQENPNYNAMEVFDKVYQSNYSKWIKYANSLKLRMAMRIRFADPVLAQQKAEEAVNHPIGVMTSNTENAYNPYPSNPVWMMSNAWGDSRACADIICYMKGYNDPRLSKYFTISKAKKEDGELAKSNDYFGLRTGITIPNKSWANNFSSTTYKEKDDVLFMCAAEIAFLRAEGSLLGWNMGGQTADLYEEGVKLSFAQWQADGAASYLNDDSSLPQGYTPPKELLFVDAPDFTEPAPSTITIKWDDAADHETKLERIITQKWIASYPLGQEAWSEQRRTGYPKFFKVLTNASGDPLLSTRFASRIPFAPSEKTENAANYPDAVKKLGGEDTYATKLWWDKNPNKGW